jgi:very-short-patch-repair endonuclease
VTDAELAAVIARAPPQHRGISALRTVAAGGRAAPTRSALERAFLRLLAEAGLPAPRVNHRIARDLVDFTWRAERVVVETDGWAAHGHRRAFESDRARDARRQAEGYAVLRFTWRQVTEEPVRVAARVAQTLGMRAR